MKQVELKRYGKLYSFYLPETWTEIDAAKFIEITPYLLQDTPENRLAILRKFLTKNSFYLYFRLNAVQVYEIAKQIDWMYSEAMAEPIIPFITNQKGTNLYLPTATLGNCVLIEYAFAHFYIQKIMQGDSSYLDFLLVCLCRPEIANYNPDSPNYGGDRREKFNPVLIEARVKLIAKIDARYKLYLLLFFIGCQKQLAAKFPAIFAQIEEEVPKEASPYGLLGTIWDLAGSIDKEEQVQYALLHNTFGFLSHQHFINDKLKHANA
jgi:hypothetical protein